MANQSRVVRVSNGKNLKRLQQLGGRLIKVGVLGNAGQHANADVPVARLARWHEFGAGHNPERPFLRPTMLQNRREYFRMKGAALQKILRNELTAQQAVDIIGGQAAQDVQKTINSFPLRDDGSKPLIDTGQLKQSISYGDA